MEAMIPPSDPLSEGIQPSIPPRPKRLTKRRAWQAPQPEPWKIQAYPSLAFHPFVSALVEGGGKRLADRLSPRGRAPVSGPRLRLDALIPPLLAGLQLRLCQQASRVLVLELHLEALAGRLAGATPEERFAAFVARLGRGGKRRALLDKYPLLASSLAEQVELWIGSIGEMIARLSADWLAVCSSLEARADDELTDLRVGEGDRHRGGRSVSILTFASGFRLVYKPRSLALEKRFEKLLSWLNDRGDHPPLRAPRTLARKGYGWMEHIDASPCAEGAQLERFYHRQGAFLAVLYVLEATDVHAENLIAAGENPLLVDLESLFHPRFSLASDIELDMLSRSVLRVGLLPRRLGAGGAGPGFDLSGLGARAGQLSPQAVPAWMNPGTDQMRFIRLRRELPGYQNRPTLSGTEVDPLGFLGALEKGFESMYRLLLSRREEILSAFLAEGVEDPVRVLLRPTWLYGALLEDSFHPDLLRDPARREGYFEALRKADWGHPGQAAIYEAERRDLTQGDIPYFSSRAGSRGLFDSEGRLLVPDFFVASALDGARETLKGLGETDLARQLSILRGTLAILPAIDQLAESGSVRTPFPVPRGPSLAKARAVGERLAALAFVRGDEASWHTLSSPGGRHLTLEPVGTDLYSGLAGIALFLAFAGACCGEPRFEDLARKAIRRALRRIDSEPDGVPALGAFTGLGGVIYALTLLSCIWTDAGLKRKAVAYARLAGTRIDEDGALDLMSGAAGCIGALLPLFELTGSKEVLAVARACGDRLLARAEPFEGGVGWRTSVCAHPLTGFSHGNAGMAWALAKLAEVTGDPRYGTCARAALAFERHRFDPERKNWPDLRFPDDTGADRFMVAWCHGAAGIGLGRLALPGSFWDPEVKAEIAAALRTTRAAGLPGNHSLCHGALGNLELLAQARRHAEFQSWDLEYRQAVELTTRSLETEGFRGGAPGAVETPGLLTGLSGLGYSLLQSCRSLPSPLILESFQSGETS